MAWFEIGQLIGLGILFVWLLVMTRLTGNSKGQLLDNIADMLERLDERWKKRAQRGGEDTTGQEEDILKKWLSNRRRFR